MSSHKDRLAAQRRPPAPVAVTRKPSEVKEKAVSKPSTTAKNPSKKSTSSKGKK